MEEVALEAEGGESKGVGGGGGGGDPFASLGRLRRAKASNQACKEEEEAALGDCQ